ncbi:MULTISPECIES: type II toxin-antitoxin system YafQ family toxin [Megamonas]|jgi:mRNA interferase YafQ|uniref:Type II toxin-antitoxin system YafQ family toxin n=1 Tax=Megamonas rupellensis TaxID=491921 RepID=A0A411ZTT9_9FIRM|nr:MULTISPECIES: type II toxin-antitoxin system YafQ family toxin [Megamonas]RGO05413.1 type II toxin-antitoxin system YafQ family toxin [Megamonas rupellensis]RGQ06240.1 type II toxin-antitoxin system YafQ family toxin [Megamonas rupellensis]
MLKIKYHSKFKKDIKTIKKRNYDLSKLQKVIEILAEEKTLPAKYKDHSLTGIYQDFRECHILPDWLLIYRIAKDILTLVLSRTGTHSDLF